MDIFKEFNRSDKMHQANILMNFGGEIGRKKNSQFCITLMQLEKYFFEVWYDVNMQKVDRIVRVFDSDILASYLDEIDLDEIFNNN